MVPRPVAEQYANGQRRSVSAMLLARRAWAGMGEDLDAGWARVGPKVSLIVASAQLGAARDGSQYVADALAYQGQNVTPMAAVNARALVGVSAGGFDLDALLYGAVVHAREAKVGSLPERLQVGRSWLDTVVQTSVSDAGRDAQSLATTARPKVSWVRFVNSPCCQRCAVLAGRVYRYSQSFQRHPRCDCMMVPQTVADPRGAGAVIGPDDVKDLTAKQREAIDKGSDFNKTINDHQRKRGDYLQPTRVDQITARAGSRDAAVEALVQAGYLAA